MLPIGANPWIWTSPVTLPALSTLVPRVAEWGFDAIELPVEQVGDWDPAEVHDLLATFGLVCPAVLVVTPPGRDLVYSSTVESTRDYLRSCVDAAVAVGAGTIGGPAYAAVGRTWRMSAPERAECYRQFRAGLAPVADYAGERGVSIGIEALNRYETSVANTMAQLIEMIDGLPDNVGIMLDTYHMNIEEADPYAAVTLAGPYVKHVQVSGSDRGAPGSDHFDWRRFRDALLATGYRGALCIESFTGDNETIATAASIWRPLAPSQDRLATDGLAYLRRLLAHGGDAAEPGPGGR